jgi:hypothetical protein
MKSHSNHGSHGHFETTEFRQRDRRPHDYDRNEWKRANYEEEEPESEPRESPPVPESTSGNSLLIVLILLGVSIVMVSGLYTYSSSSVRLNKRNNDYYVAVAAAEAATEKVLSQITSDFQNYGDGYVEQQLGNYRQQIPSSSESSQWTNFTFMDLAGTQDRLQVDYTSLSGFTPVGGQYGPLKAFTDRIRILSNVRPKSSLDGVVGSVYQDVELTRIPIYQYAIFYNITLEFTPLPPMNVGGPVHCNANIYMNPAGPLTFLNDVTSSGTIVAGPNPVGPFGNLGGTVTYNGAHDSGVSTLSLPIGTNNSPAAVVQVLDIPSVLENPQSSMGQQRFYNKADLIFIVSNNVVLAETGLWNSFGTLIPTNEWSIFLSTNVSFYNKRELKTVKTIQLDVAKFNLWNATNARVRPFLPLHDVRTIYIADQRTLSASFESGVRVVNGSTLPPQGLTVATPSPFYVWGNYNCPPSALGTTNTTGTLPASFAADAITVLSTNWSDARSSNVLSSRVGGNTTVNAAFLTGIVATTSSSDSGGVENFPRFLEDWTGYTLTYNGSMVAMYYSRIATGAWTGIGDPPGIYNPPNRNWSLDQNYQYSDKLPPATPSLTVLVRSNWRTPAAFSTNVMAGF